VYVPSFRRDASYELTAMTLARSRNQNRLRARPGGSRGQAQVEFVLTILFLMLFIFGTLELILLVYTYNVFADSAKEGVRYAIVHGTASANCSGPGGGGVTCTDSSGANVQSAVKSFAQYSMHSTSTMTVTVNYPDGSSVAPNRVAVHISYPYQPFFGLGWPTVTVNAAAAGRIMF
jgi:Flp pilus assembly protein TadG